MPTLTVVYILSAAALGVLLGAWLGSRIGKSAVRAARETAENLQFDAEKRDGEIAALRAQLTTAQERAVRAESDAAHLAELKTTLENTEKSRDTVRLELAAAHGEIARLSSDLDNERKRVEEVLQTEERLTDKFKTLAQDILDQKSKVFAEQNQSSIDTLLTPIREKFTEFQQKVTELREQGIEHRTELKAQLENLGKLNERLSADANNLVQALKGSSKTQGDWGELLLEQILESAGLRKGEQYFVQQTFTNHDGKPVRPDVVLALPEGKHLILDSKVSLRDYSDYSAAEDESIRQAALDRHLAAVHSHIKELGRREYHTLPDLKSTDFVVMFVPIEPAYILALTHDHSLWQKAWDQNVLLVGPSTLLFVVRTVAQLLRQEQQNRNAEQISQRGAKLLDKLIDFVNDLKGIGDSLDKARFTYDEAFKKLASGKGNAIRQAEMLRSLGVKSTKRMPAQVAEMARLEPLELAAVADENSANDE
jgi:DNA recombination protein RmuC